ncbi:syndecan-like isoform X1 [Haliotis rufescens]|uniref:syndecan-like isoform X1 n=1 Tax=Haliotis rufescens TaxID=6454 RepID=UPI001EB0639C|nr:syndecan-like isoform X1 [Haliotis rufescens]
MLGKSTLIFLGLLALITLSLAQARQGADEQEPPGNLIDIDTEIGKEKEEVPEESGSGIDPDENDDDDLDKSSGSGSGSRMTEEVETDSTTPKPLTPCENLREASKHLLGNYVPRCTPSGQYAPMQCRGHPGTGKCWCSDSNGAEIPGTALDPPRAPDCENGDNLHPCVFKLVQHIRSPMYGTFRPRCKMNGEFEELQCHGSECFCVDARGEKIYGTEVPIHDGQTEKCITITTQEATVPPLIEPDSGIVVEGGKPRKPKPQEPGYTVAPETPATDTELDHKDNNEIPEDDENNETGDDPEKASVASAHIMTQPGLLAAIIGGAVVGLLCAILLVMFIVYRMRKKDEGSYALDEPRKKSTYSPINQSEKEYYA